MVAVKVNHIKRKRLGANMEIKENADFLEKRTLKEYGKKRLFSLHRVFVFTFAVLGILIMVLQGICWRDFEYVSNSYDPPCITKTGNTPAPLLVVSEDEPVPDCDNSQEYALLFYCTNALHDETDTPKDLAYIILQ